MEPQATAAHVPQPAVTMARIKATLDQVPVDRLNEVYEYLITLLEDADDVAAVNAARVEMERTGDRGMLLDDFLRERGLTDAVDRLAKSEGLDVDDE